MGGVVTDRVTICIPAIKRRAVWLGEAVASALPVMSTPCEKMAP